MLWRWEEENGVRVSYGGPTDVGGPCSTDNKSEREIGENVL